jgi:hypothetical protein
MSTSIENLESGKVPSEGVDLILTSKNDLNDSEMTPHTESGSVSEDEAGGWLGAIGSDFRNIATCFKANIPPVLGGMANLVHKTAMSVAAEIAQLEHDSELDAERWKEESPHGSPDKESGSLSLPWEIRRDLGQDGIPVYVTDEQLMEDILGLSLLEKTFREPFSPSTLDSTGKASFVLDEPRIYLIRRLLDMDENLAAMHARLSGEFTCQIGSAIRYGTIQIGSFLD